MNLKGKTRKKVLVTGSLGYLGSVLTDYLEQRKLETDNFAHEIARFGEEMNNRPKIREKTFLARK